MNPQTSALRLLTSLLCFPNIVLTINIRQLVVRIDLHGCNSRCRWINKCPHTTALPDIYRQVQDFSFTIGLGYFQVDRHSQFLFIYEGYLGAVFWFVLYIFYTLDGLIQFPGSKGPWLEEPVQVLTGSIIHCPEKVVRQRVFKCPVFNILMKRIVKAIRTKHYITQHVKTTGSFIIILAVFILCFRSNHQRVFFAAHQKSYLVGRP